MKYLLPLVILASAWPAVAQSRSTVTLAVSAMRPNPSAKTITLTLASGAQITVPMTDVTSEPVATRATPAVTPAASVISPTDAVIHSKCARDWPADFSVRAYCERTQREAVGKLNARAMTDGDRRLIRTKCASDWPDDFSVRNYCEEQQLKALQSLNR